MQFRELELPGVLRIDVHRIEDERGFFARVFCQREMVANGLSGEVVQCNNTFTRLRGTIRGMHFQRPPKAETKIVRCLRGAIFDVAVDLRVGSPTFGKWCGIELNGEDRSMVYIPQGYAHGFQTLEPETELLYFHSEFYSPTLEGGLHPLDPDVGIEWPLAVQSMSERDLRLPYLHDFAGLQL